MSKKEKIEEIVEEKAETLEEEVAELSPEEKAKLEKKLRKHRAKKRFKNVYSDFKKFISKGDAVNLAVGVVIGSAFTAIVTSITNIFLSLCTWAVPGGMKGLVTILPPAGDAQRGLFFNGQLIINQSFESSQLYSLAEMYAKLKKTTPDASDIQSALNEITSKYTLHGGRYIFNGAAIVDWGALLNAILAFIIIALVLFLIVKLVLGLKKAAAQAQAYALEEYYKKHPDERPAPEDPKAPEKTEKDLLKEILLVLKQQNPSKSKNKTKKK